MTGAQLEIVLENNNVDRPKLYKNLGMSRQLFGTVLKRKSIDSELLKNIATFTKIPITELLSEPVKAAPDMDFTTVNEAHTKYGKPQVSNEDLIQETKKIYAENVELHKTIAARGEFILKLLNS